VKTGIYTEGREWKPHEPAVFLGVDAEKFHEGITKYVNMTGDAFEHAYEATKWFIGKRWYVAAIPIVLSASIGMYGLLMSAKPDVEIQEAANKKRRKSHVEYLMKYYGQGKQKIREFTSATIDDKVDTQEATK